MGGRKYIRRGARTESKGSLGARALRRLRQDAGCGAEKISVCAYKEIMMFLVAAKMSRPSAWQALQLCMDELDDMDDEEFLTWQERPDVRSSTGWGGKRG